MPVVSADGVLPGAARCLLAAQRPRGISA